MKPILHLAESLTELQRQGLLRGPEGAAVRASRRDWIDASSNDYLGAAATSVSRETWQRAEDVRAGAGSSRLIHGSYPEHAHLERLLADWVGAEAALALSSGYAANLGVLSALPQPRDLIVSDELNHASIIDGCRLSRARVAVTPHLDLQAVADALGTSADRRWVVVESYYSMDGDTPDLQALAELCESRGAYLIVDEAHALGVFGPSGAGLCAARGVVPHVLIGTLGKAVGVQGAFIAGSTDLRTYLWNCARSFVFSTGISPFLAKVADDRVRRTQADDHGRNSLSELAEMFSSRLQSAGIELPPGRHGPIFPVVVGTEERALSLARRLRGEGFLVQAIRPPSVPAHSSRLRITLTAKMAPEQVERLAESLVKACVASS